MGSGNKFPNGKRQSLLAKNETDWISMRDNFSSKKTVEICNPRTRLPVSNKNFFFSCTSRPWPQKERGFRFSWTSWVSSLNCLALRETQLQVSERVAIAVRTASFASFIKKKKKRIVMFAGGWMRSSRKLLPVEQPYLKNSIFMRSKGRKVRFAQITPNLIRHRADERNFLKSWLVLK